MLKAIVFDFDGVVVDSEPLHYEAIREVAQTVGYDFDYRHYLAEYVGFDDRDAFRHVLAEAGRPVEERQVAQLCEHKKEAFERRATAGVRMIPGARELIEQAAGTMPIAIASGAIRADIELILRGLGLRDRFAVVVSADDVAVSKPHPATYARAVELLATANPNLNLQPGNCLAIEDTAAGVDSARGAGLMTLALTTTGPAAMLQRAMRVVADLSGVTLDELRRWYEG